MEGIYYVHSYNYNYPPLGLAPVQQPFRDKLEKPLHITSLEAVGALHNNTDQLGYNERRWKDMIPNTNQNERLALIQKRRQMMEQSVVNHLGSRFDQYM